MEGMVGAQLEQIWSLFLDHILTMKSNRSKAAFYAASASTLQRVDSVKKEKRLLQKK